ncbi:MAG: hypothetical protein HY774_00725 [Acidobacteria bacterium]|nr:hypothetical protein [Acidobacteriota bacterium]
MTNLFPVVAHKASQPPAIRTAAFQDAQSKCLIPKRKREVDFLQSLNATLFMARKCPNLKTN